MKTLKTLKTSVAHLRNRTCANASRPTAVDWFRSRPANQRATEQVLFNALMATLDPGDKVIVPAP